jgi:hypothetical protein
VPAGKARDPNEIVIPEIADTGFVKRDDARANPIGREVIHGKVLQLPLATGSPTPVKIG